MKVLIDFALRIGVLDDEITDTDPTGQLRDVLESYLQEETSWPHDDRSRLRADCHVLTDLAMQKWCIRVNDGKIEVAPSVELSFSLSKEKARIRAQELVKRDEQLLEPSVRTFVASMEKRRVFGTDFVSVFSIMRDGRQLASELEKIRHLPESERQEALTAVVDPVIEVVDEDARCSETGLRLMDIWRYFRHTWSNQYVSVPGRTMAFLVRDRSAPHKPVIGIGALSSPIVQIRSRDRWIGWDSQVFLAEASKSSDPEFGYWLRSIVQSAMDEVYVDDLLEEKIVTPEQLRNPTDSVIETLIEYGKDQAGRHQRFANAPDFKPSQAKNGNDSSANRWEQRARSHLFRSKRARQLADLLKTRRVLNQYLPDQISAEDVGALLGARDGVRACMSVLRKSKADRVGIAMADISVCGAIAPYGPILGGKLVAMLAVSPELVSAYRDRYGTAESEIASSMAGRPIVRASDLVLLGTTSLYGVGSSQYNRIRIPALVLGGNANEEIRYYELGRSEAFGSSHFSAGTIRALTRVLEQSTNGVRVHSIFGEGVSPKLRKIRDGLEALGLPPDVLLRHGRRRIVYGIPLARNFRRYLTGQDSTPEYIAESSGEPATNAIAAWWRERWLLRRIESDDVLDSVASHTLVHPIRHGARASLPPEDSDQGSLFSDLD